MRRDALGQTPMTMEFIRFTWANNGKEHLVNPAAIAYVSPAPEGPGAVLHLLDGETVLLTVEPYETVARFLNARTMQRDQVPHPPVAGMVVH